MQDHNATACGRPKEECVPGSRGRCNSQGCPAAGLSGQRWGPGRAPCLPAQPRGVSSNCGACFTWFASGCDLLAYTPALTTCLQGKNATLRTRWQLLQQVGQPQAHPGIAPIQFTQTRSNSNNQRPAPASRISLRFSSYSDSHARNGIISLNRADGNIRQQRQPGRRKHTLRKSAAPPRPSHCTRRARCRRTCQSSRASCRPECT